MKHTLRLLTSTLLLLVAACWGLPAFAQNACSFNVPPRDSAVSANDGRFYFVYPRKVTATYTGCQTMWDELGRKVFLFRFKQGTLTEYWLADYSSNAKRETCKYHRGAVSPSSSKECPAYEDVKHGLLTVAPQDEPPVPRERDARLIWQKSK
jgi:hypothetical protein